MNISSAVVNISPGCGWVVRLALQHLPSVEVHAVSADGKFVITFECTDDGAAADMFEAVQRMDGVLSAALVFSQTEEDPNQEICDETDAT